MESRRKKQSKSKNKRKRKTRKALAVLTLGTDSEEFQFVRDGFEPSGARDAFFEDGRKTLADLHDFRARTADEMVMVFVMFGH